MYHIIALLLFLGMFSSVEANSVNINKPLLQRDVLVIGCPRAGTLFVTQVLHKCGGIDVGHEKMGPRGIVSWLFSATSSNPAWGPIPAEYTFKNIFHQVRHPIKCIATLHLVVPRAWDYICREVPEIRRDEPILVRAAKMWVYWNLKAEKKAEMTYRVEAIEAALPEISKRLGIPLDAEKLKEISTTTHSKNKKIVITWQDLHQALEPKFYKKLVLLAKRYGYDVTEGLALIK